MNLRDIKAFGEALAPVIKDYVAQIVSPIEEGVKTALAGQEKFIKDYIDEKILTIPNVKGDPGEVDPEALQELVNKRVSETVAEMEIDLDALAVKCVDILPAQGPTMVYKGIYSEGEYLPGDTVTHSGSLWHCNEKTEGKPGTGDDWTLCAKRGRDGKDK